MARISLGVNDKATLRKTGGVAQVKPGQNARGGISKGTSPNTGRGGIEKANVVSPQNTTPGITLPDLPNTSDPTVGVGSTPGGGTQSLGIESLLGTSIPAVDSAKIAKDTKKEFSGFIRGIGSKFDRRIGEASNQFRQEGRALRGQMGTGRRFSSSAEAFMQYVDTENAKKLDALEEQKQEALSAGEFEVAQLIETRIANNRQAAQQEFNNLITAYDLLAKEEAKTAKKGEDIVTSEKQAAVLDVMNEGVTDINDIFNKVRESRDDVTLEDITGALTEIGQNITGKIDPGMADKLTGDAKNFLLMKNSFPEYLPAQIASLPESEQLGAYIRWVEGKGQTSKIANGGGTSNALPGQSGYDRGILVSRLGSQIYGKTISDTESKRVEAFIDAGMKMGKSEQEIADDVIGFKVTRNKPLAEKLRNSVMSATNENGIKDFDMMSLARLINDGNDAQAVQKVEQYLYKRAKESETGDYVGETSVRYASQKADEVSNLVYSLADIELDDGMFSNEPDSAKEIDESIGNFSGTIQNWLGRFASEDAQAIQTSIVGLVAEMRNKLSGTAVTDSEKAFLAPLIPDLSDKPSVFMNKLAQLKSDPLLKLNSMRAVYNLPTLDDESLNDYGRRVPSYMAPPTMSDDDFFNNPLPVGTGTDTGAYDPSVWSKAP